MLTDRARNDLNVSKGRKTEIKPKIAQKPPIFLLEIYDREQETGKFCLDICWFLGQLPVPESSQIHENAGDKIS